MNTILTQTTGRIAVITTIVNPDVVTDLSELADSRIIVGSLYRLPEIMYFQFDILIPPVSPDRSQSMANQMYTEFLEHLASPGFVERYGHGMKLGGADIKVSEHRKIETRLKSAFERMLRFNNQSSYIRSHHSRNGACIIELRLPRGLSVRAINYSLAVEIERENRPATGAIHLDGIAYSYTFWFPSGISLENMDFEVLKEATKKEINQSFPFINTSNFQMTQTSSLSRNNEF